MLILTGSSATVSLSLFVLFVVPVVCSYSSDIISNTYQVDSTNIPYTETREARKNAKRLARRIARWGFNVDALLERYGYLRSLPEPRARTQGHILSHSRSERKEAIRLFQQFNGLKETGKLNKKTINVMKNEPRCGLPDVKLTDPRSVIRNFHFYNYFPRWRRSVLTWRSSKSTQKVSPLGQWKALKKAFETWSAVSGIRFLYTRTDPDINIRFEQGNHGDGRWNAFDFKGGASAHAFGPGDYSISGDIHLDEAEDWTLEVNPKDGVNLLGVAIHEIGHSLGLQHSSVPQSVMNPSFRSTRLDLDISDIQEVQRLYGPNPEMNEEMYTVQEAKAAPKVCKVAMEDLELGPDGYGYIFRQSFLRKIDKQGKIVKTPTKLHIADVYHGGPKRIDAVAYWTEIKRTYMFRNDTVWRFTNFDLDPGYPKAIIGRLMPEMPRAAAVVRDQYGVTRVLLFGVNQFWEWDTSRDQVQKGYPLNTGDYFEGLPRAPAGATRWKDGYVYFIKGDKYYKVHPGSYRVMKGFPKPMPPDWMKGVC